MKEDGIIIHTDGGARGNPGPAACAFVVDIGDKTIMKGSSYLGKATNNHAEYHGVLLAADWLSKNYKNYQEDKVIFYLDSELVVRQLSGIYKVKDNNLNEIFLQIKDLLKNIDLTIFYKHIPREKNLIADSLVNKELDLNSHV
jgi:ribonuclease HI